MARRKRGRKGKAAVLGVENVVDNLNKELKGIRTRGQAGMVKGGLLIKRVAVQKASRITGNMRNSAYVVLPEGERGRSGSFTGEEAGERATEHKAALDRGVRRTRRAKRRGGIGVGVGFSAVYALKVHEDLNAGAAGFNAALHIRKNARGKIVLLHSRKGEPKFLENAIRENTAEFVRIVAQDARVN